MSRYFIKIQNGQTMAILSAMIQSAMESGVKMKTEGDAPEIGEVLQYDEDTRVLSKAEGYNGDTMAPVKFAEAVISHYVMSMGPRETMEAMLNSIGRGALSGKRGVDSEGVEHKHDFVLDIPEVFNEGERRMALDICVNCIRKAIAGEDKYLDHIMSDKRVIRLLLARMLVAEGYPVREVAEIEA